MLGSEFCKYMKDYADHFDLMKNIKLNTFV